VSKALPSGKISFLAKNVVITVNAGQDTASIALAWVCHKIHCVTVMKTATLNFSATLLKNGPTNQHALLIKKLATVALRTLSAPSTTSAGTPLQAMLFQT